MGVSIPPEKDYSPDNPFAGGKQYSPDNPFQTAAPRIPTKLEIAKRNASMPHPEDTEDAEPSYAQKALGGIAALGHDIPGVEALQAGARSMNSARVSGKKNAFGYIPTERTQSYTDALGDIRGAENAAPKGVKLGNSLIGGTIAAAATPGADVMLQGARFGIGEALGSADPSSLKDRLDAVPLRATIDAAAGKVFGELAPNVARVIAAKSLGKNVLQRTAAMDAADAVNFPKAKAEGDLAAANPTPQAVSDALNETDVRPYVAVVRGSGLFQGANDATVLREAYKLMGEKERTLGSRIVGSDDFKAGSELERNELIEGKRKLGQAAQGIMPSFAPANLAHAQAEGQLDALKAAADQTGRVLNNNNIAGKKLATNSREAFLASILTQNKAEAQAAREGVLGKIRETTGRTGIRTVNPLKVFGWPKSAWQVNKMAPYVNALDEQAGDAGPILESTPWNKVGYLKKALGISAGNQAGN